MGWLVGDEFEKIRGLLMLKRLKDRKGKSFSGCISVYPVKLSIFAILALYKPIIIFKILCPRVL